MIWHTSVPSVKVCCSLRTCNCGFYIVYQCTKSYWQKSQVISINTFGLQTCMLIYHQLPNTQYIISSLLCIYCQGLLHDPSRYPICVPSSILALYTVLSYIILKKTSRSRRRVKYCSYSYYMHTLGSHASQTCRSYDSDPSCNLLQNGQCHKEAILTLY